MVFAKKDQKCTYQIMDNMENKVMLKSRCILSKKNYIPVPRDLSGSSRIAAMTSIPNTRYEIWRHITDDLMSYDANKFNAVYTHTL